MVKQINIKFLIFSILLIFLSYELVIHFDTLSNNIFMWFDYFNVKHTPYYDLFHGLLVFLILTSFVVLSRNIFYLKMWLWKAFVTILLMMAYEAYYGLDAFVYFGRAVLYKDLTWYGQHGTMFIVYFNHMLSYIVGDSYYAMKIVSSFIGFLGLIFLYKSFEYIMQKSDLPIHPWFPYIFFLLPSVIFWSSILGKDPLNLFLVGMFTYGFVHIIDTFRLRYLFMIVFAVFAVSYIRSWYSVIMVGSMFLYFLKFNSAKNILFFMLSLPVFVVLAQQLLQSMGITSMDVLFLKMSETTKNLSYGKSAVEAHVITGFGDYLLHFVPNLFTSLFRPMPWDIRNPFTLMAAVENTIMLYLAYKYIFKNWRAIYANKYLKFFILFIFSWSLFYVIISPANLGGAVRFKLQVLPAMLILIGAAMSMSQKRAENRGSVEKS